MFPYWTIYTACRMSVCTLLLVPLSLPPPQPSLLFFPRSSSLSLHVGSSLRLHFSCLGSALSSPANKSSANLLPESLCPCSDCSSPAVARQHGQGKEGPRERARGAEERRGGGKEEEEREGRLKKKKTPHRYQMASSAVLKQQASLCQKVFQRAGSFP